MPASQEQKVDFLLKKIGYSASKTGIAEDESTISSSNNTAKAPFEEGIASPLVIPQSSILADSGYIPTTPPGSDTPYVKGYRTATALRMTRDSTVGTNTRSYIAFETYNDTSSTRLTNWIDTQFGASYIIKVFKGDPNSGGVELQQAGANAGTDGWFFDYSSGILNFNGVNLPSGISATNIYIVGYRYIGATGIRPPAGIGTFESLHVSGIATFKDDVEFHGVSGITSVSFDKSDNSFKFVDGAKLKIGTGLTVSSNGTSIEYFNNSNIFHNIENSGQKESWLSRVSGVLVPQFRINHNSGVEAFHANGGIKFSTTGYGVTVFGTTETQTLNVTGVSTFSDHLNISGRVTCTAITINDGQPGLVFEDTNANPDFILQNRNGTFAIRDVTSTPGVNRFFVNAANGDVTVTGDIDASGDLDVDGHTELDNLNVSGVSTFSGLIDANGIIEGVAGQNKIPSLYNAFSDLPNAGTYHGMFAHVHQHARGYFAHAGNWLELVNKETDGRVGTGTETYNVGFLDATNLDVTGITTLGNIGISTGRITGPAITYIDPATVGDDTGTLVVKGNLQVEGTQTTVNSSTMTVTDKNIELAKGAANDAAADGGGITVDSGGGDKTWQWLDATDSWTSSEHIRIPDGKVFGFATDTNTYIGRPAADTIAFTHGGSERVRITSSQTRIGSQAATDTTSYEIQLSGAANNDSILSLYNPTTNNGEGIHQGFFFKNSNNTVTEFARIKSTAIETTAATAKGDLRFYTRSGSGGISNSSERLRVQHDGNVGINSTSPKAKLDVIGDTKLQGNLSVSGISTFDGRVLIGTTTEGHANADDLTIATSGDTGMTIRSGTSHNGRIYFSDATSGAGEVVGSLDYDHNNDSFSIFTNNQFRLRIDSSGRLLLGTDTEGHPNADDFTVATSGDTGITIRSGTTNNGRIYFSDATSGTGEVVGSLDYDHNDNKFTIHTNGVSRFLIDGSGNVGINSGLTVSGISTFNDDVTFFGTNPSVSANKIIFDKSNNQLTFFDNTKANFGQSGDLQIYHQSAVSYIDCTNNYPLHIQSNDLRIRKQDGGEEMITAAANGTVRLYYNGSQKFTTTNTGVSITGITTTTQLEVGTLGQSLVGITTILDEDNFASNSATALATQQSIKAYVDSSNPTGSNLAVSADSGSNESINLATEVLDIEGTANEIETATGTNKVVIGLPDNVSIGGTLNVGNGLNVTGITTFVSKNVHIGNSSSGSTGRLNFGSGNPLSIFYDSNTQDAKILKSGGSGNLDIQVSSGSVDIITGTTNTAAKFTTGSVQLYRSNSVKLETTSSGIEVTGLTDTDTLTTGNATFTGTISAGSTTGVDGYYLKSTGIGVTWAVLPSSRTTSTQTATAGQTTFNFSYNIGFVDVFLNGVKLPSSEFTASNGSTIVLDDAAFANDTLEFISLNTLPVTSSGGASNLDGLADVTISGTPVIGETLQHNGSQFVNDYTVSSTTTSTSQTAILNLPVVTYRSVEYTIQITEGTKYHVTKVLAIHDGTNVTFNEYGTLTTSTSLSTFALDVNSGNMRLLATPASTNSTVFKVKFTGIKV